MIKKYRKRKTLLPSFKAIQVLGDKNIPSLVLFVGEENFGAQCLGDFEGVEYYDHYVKVGKELIKLEYGDYVFKTFTGKIKVYAQKVFEFLYKEVK